MKKSTVVGIVASNESGTSVMLKDGAKVFVPLPQERIYAGMVIHYKTVKAGEKWGEGEDQVYKKDWNQYQSRDLDTIEANPELESKLALAAKYGVSVSI